MVLKNSNSRLNSGATQRNIRGNVLRVDPLQFSEQADCLKMSAFSADTYHQPEKSDRFKECLNKIYNYLGWEGPKLTPYNRSDVFGLRPTTYLSTNKRQMWNIPERIKSLLADVDFLEKVNAILNLKVEQTQMTPFTKGKGGKYKKRKIQSSSEVITKSSLEKSEQGMPLRQRHTYHGRGVQRPHLWKRAKKFKDNNHEDEQPGDGREELNITVYEPFHIDARSGIMIRNPHHKSFAKSKHCLKGRMSYRKGYTYQEINEDLNYSLDEIHECAYPFDKVTCESEEGLESEMQTPGHSQRYILSDFIKERCVWQKNRKRRTGNILMKAGENTLFKERVKYPKGSYIIVPCEQSISVQTDDSMEMLDFNETSILDDSNNSEQSEMMYSVLNFVETENVSEESDSKMQAHDQEGENQFQINIKKFSDSFTTVNLLLQDSEISTMSSTYGVAGEQQVTLIDGHTVFIANSLPPCFVVELNWHSKGAKEKPYILVKKTRNSSTSWLVSFQGTKGWQSQWKERLKELLENEWNTETSLTQLIETAESLTHDFAPNKVVRTSFSPKAKVTRSDTVWQSLSNILVPQEAIVGTIDEALSHLQIPSEGMHMFESRHSGMEVFDAIQWPDKYMFHSKECGICFLPCTFTSQEDESALALLPCMHSFCVSCWRAHVYHSIRQGIFEISCMDSKCTNKLDKVAAMGILPYDFIISWQNLWKERRVDASAVSTRCPNNGCHCIAVLPQKSQFGTLVQCNCQHCWCGSCQSDPHWPASCDQMAVYKKLLCKKRKTPTSTTDFFIELKRCPKCRQPIEKNKGCPNMLCTMCQTSFCWYCLKLSHTHRVYNCVKNTDNFETFNLQNKLVYDIPVKHLEDSFLVHQRLKSIHDTSNWLSYLDKVRDGVYKPPRHFYHLADCKIAVKELVDVVEQCVLFLKQAYTLQESFYVLLCFTHLSKRKSCAKIAISNMSQLNFITDRLNNLAIGKSLNELRKVDKRVLVLIEAGKKVLYQLTSMVPVLQHLSKDVETEWVGNLDLTKHARYQ